MRQRLRNEDEGFTLIELMVVVLIIAILIAIAIPTFLGAQDRARERGAQSNLRNALTAAKTIATDAEGVFSGVSTTTMAAAEGSLSFITTVSTTTTPKEIGVVPSAGVLGNAAEGTVGGTLLLSVRSASGKYFGICSDYQGKVQYSPASAAVPTLATCIADKF